LATSLQFLASWRIAVREHFQEPYAAQGKAGAKVFATAVAENKFGATSADIQKQQWISRQRCIGRHPCKNQISLLRARKDVHLQARLALDGHTQFFGIDRLARCAGGDDAK